MYGFWGKIPTRLKETPPLCLRPTEPTARPNIAQGWIVTDPQALAEIGPVPEGEEIIEIPEDVLKFYRRS